MDGCPQTEMKIETGKDSQTPDVKPYQERERIPGQFPTTCIVVKLQCSAGSAARIYT